MISFFVKYFLIPFDPSVIILNNSGFKYILCLKVKENLFFDRNILLCFQWLSKNLLVILQILLAIKTLLEIAHFGIIIALAMILVTTNILPSHILSLFSDDRRCVEEEDEENVRPFSNIPRSVQLTL